MPQGGMTGGTRDTAAFRRMMRENPQGVRRDTSARRRMMNQQQGQNQTRQNPPAEKPDLNQN
jgi:hypothetical protein